MRDSESVDLLVPAKLVDVRLDDDGRVAAAVLETPDGSTEEVPTRAVLLATNGYGADRALVTEHLPEIADAVYHGSEASRGDALRIGRALGADVAFLDAYQGHGALAQRTSTLVGWATIMHGGIIVGADGRRFGNETSGYSEYAAVIAAQPGAAGWIVLDQRIHDACLVSPTSGRPSTAARWSGPTTSRAWRRRRVFRPTRWRRSCGLPRTWPATRPPARTGSDARSSRRPSSRRSPPSRWCPALFHTQGGLRVDGSARVLRPDDTPIEGLYASGGAAAGISGHGAAGYLAGNGLLPALGLAFLAAEDAARIPARSDDPSAQTTH